MQLRILTEPQEGATYDDLLLVARESERLGFEGFFRSDHYQHIGADDPGPGSTDAWVTLAGLARETSVIRIGTLVSAVTFRRAGPLAVAVATVDAMSGGRVELGLGCGWFEDEHASYGMPFPSLEERFDLLEEHLAVVTGLWATPRGETFSFSGRHETLIESPALPKPAQHPRPPIIIGGTGTDRTPCLAARYADEYNVPPFEPVDVTVRQFDIVRKACERVDRDPCSLVLSKAYPLMIGTREEDVRRRAAKIGMDASEARSVGLCGLVSEVVDELGRLEELGATRAYLDLMDLTDLEQIQLVADEVVPQLAARA
ncbi:MAG: hypothetical protein QOK30_3501 [Nocardioidaceae bacterium]|jgi:alkanesulfonate monooxygenase|nr:hypothetical protein [Nocardioidaceae bacterium]